MRSLSATIALHGDTYDEAYQHAARLAQDNGMVFIHPYDDPDVIAGQGTIAVEMLRQHTDPLHAIFIPVGGGGLLAGVAVYVKYLWPEIRIIGVEPEDAASMYHALRTGERVMLDHVGIFADGVAVRQAGKRISASPNSVSTRSSWSAPTRSAPQSRISSTIPAPSPNPPGRWRWRDSRNMSSAKGCRERT